MSTCHQVDAKKATPFGSNGSSERKNDTLSVPGFRLSNERKSLFMKSVVSTVSPLAKGKYQPLSNQIDAITDF
jgi:hypothetical protein